MRKNIYLGIGILMALTASNYGRLEAKTGPASKKAIPEAIEKLIKHKKVDNYLRAVKNKVAKKPYQFFMAETKKFPDMRYKAETIGANSVLLTVPPLAVKLELQPEYAKINNKKVEYSAIKDAPSLYKKIQTLLPKRRNNASSGWALLPKAHALGGTAVAFLALTSSVAIYMISENHACTKINTYLKQCGQLDPATYLWGATNYLRNHPDVKCIDAWEKLYTCLNGVAKTPEGQDVLDTTPPAVRGYYGEQKTEGQR